MSHRGTEHKKRNRVAKQMRQKLPAYIDLVQHIKLRTRCTTATAYKVLLSGAIQIDGKSVGYQIEKRVNGEEFKVIQPFVMAADREKIRVVVPEGLIDG